MTTTRGRCFSRTLSSSARLVVKLLSCHDGSVGSWTQTDRQNEPVGLKALAADVLHGKLLRGGSWLTLCGAGALGSHLADNLIRQGFGPLRVIDRTASRNTTSAHSFTAKPTWAAG